MNKEYILCAAIYNSNELDLNNNPLIYCGYRHANILWQGNHVSRNPYHQGFLTSTGKFVSREEGLIIALNASQVLNINEIRNDRLFTEDLY